MKTLACPRHLRPRHLPVTSLACLRYLNQVVFNGKPLTDESIGLSPLPFINGKPLTDESIGLSPLPSPLPQRFESRIVTHVDQPVARVERGL